MEKDDREMEEMKREAMQEGDGDGGGGGGGQPSLTRDPLLQLTAGWSQEKNLSTHMLKHTHTRRV